MATNSNSQPINAKRFAALYAGWDTGNGSEEEAMSKGRALRRMAATSGLRIIDALQLPEVENAIDAQMNPDRKSKACLEKATAEAVSLRKELTERTRDVRRLADQLKAEKDKTEALREDLSNAGLPSNPRRRVSRRRVTKSLGAPSWPFEIAVIAAALALLLAATLHH
jgi:hypothetical protein